MPQCNPMEDFRRDVAYRVQRREDEAVTLTATLRDRYHDIEVEIVADLRTLTITAGRARFRAAPTPDCRRVEERLDRLRGVPIGKGLGRHLTAALGGAQGCGNLRTLLMGLLPLAINLRAAAGIADEQEMLDTIHQRLTGTCAGYSEQASETA